MTKGFVIVFHKPVPIYQLVEAEINKDEWDNDTYIILIISHQNIAIGKK